VNQAWWAAFGPAEAPVTCGEAKHRLRWADGTLQAVDHPDAEGELVLAALGGDTSPCLEMVRAWGGHTDDLTVLAVGPRSATDAVTIPAAVLDEVNALSDPASQLSRGLVTRTVTSRTANVSFGRVTGMTYGFAGSGRSPRPIPSNVVRQAALRRARLRARSFGWSGSRPLGRHGIRPLGWPGGADQPRLELIRLLALGQAFQFRLCAAVAHAWFSPSERADRWQRARPALTAALAGRLEPAVAQWLGIGPGEVNAMIHDGAGWGEITRTQGDGKARLLARLPVGWLADVWAPGFAVVGSHLVVGLVQADWPQASVLALRSPGQDPVELTIRQDQGHWSVTSR
jgi:hypothetical protein